MPLRGHAVQDDGLFIGHMPIYDDFLGIRIHEVDGWQILPRRKPYRGLRTVVPRADGCKRHVSVHRVALPVDG
ncbi:hypothetical protein G6F63_016992 [Rhizopus arrhizus]|nr:hypothetical protein G6F63_016992 [Rhizopus arrhizus]